MNIKSGDIFLIKGKGFISDSIVHFMKRYAKKKNIKYDWIGSHAGTLFWDKNSGRLVIAESVDNGFHIRIFDKHYNLEKDNYRIITPIVPYSESEQQRLWNEAMHLQTINIGYQYWNFAQWILYIETGINIFAKHGDRFTYCYESTCEIAQSVRPNDWPYKEKEIWNFFDMYNNKNFKLL